MLAQDAARVVIEKVAIALIANSFLIQSFVAYSCVQL